MIDSDSYACGVSQKPLIGNTVGNVLNSIANKYPDNDALISVEQNIRYTWKDLLSATNSVAKGLMMLGVERGMRVAIWSMNYAEWVLVQFATAKIGAILVNINPAYRSYELEYALKQSEVNTLILQGRFKTSDYVGMFYEACPEAFESKPGQISSDKFPYLHNVVFMGEIPYNGMYRWSEL